MSNIVIERRYSYPRSDDIYNVYQLYGFEETKTGFYIFFTDKRDGYPHTINTAPTEKTTTFLIINGQRFTNDDILKNPSRISALLNNAWNINAIEHLP